MSKFFKNHKKDFILWGLVLLIFGLIFLIVYYENKDKKHYSNVACNSDINIVDDLINLDTNFYIDDNGNVVSSNLFNVNDVWRDNIILDNGNYASNPSFSCFMVTLGVGTYTMSGWISGNYVNISTSNSSGQIISTLLQTNTSSSSFTFNVNNSTTFVFCFSKETNNIMLNSGSSALSYEPFGVTWFKNEGQNYSVLYNIFNNSVGKLYNYDNNDLLFTESIVLSASDVSITMNNFPTINNYLNSYDSEDTSTYPTQYFYFILELTTSTNSPLVFSLNNGILDTDIILFYNDVQLASFTRDNDNYHVFVNQDTIYTYNKISYNEFYAPDYISLDFNISTSGILYNKGFNDGVDSIKYDYQYLQTQYSNLQTQYNTLDSNYQSLLEQYNALNSDEYSLSELIWSIGSVPFAVLTSGFNVNVMGISLASIITGLFTSMLLIWIIKKFFR